MSDTKEYVIRKEGNGTFGLGEAVAPGCAFFRAGNYGLTKEQLDRKVAVIPIQQPVKRLTNQSSVGTTIQ